MKKVSFLFAVLFFLVLSVNVKAQTPTADYFSGKWSVLVKGTPNGDAKMIFVLEKNNDSLSGVVQDTTGVEISKISSIEQAENEITVYFTAQGYDVNVVLTKKDDDHSTGSLMGMFEVEGERVK
jgi:hypothetical protein